MQRSVSWRCIGADVNGRRGSPASAAVIALRLEIGAPVYP